MNGSEKAVEGQGKAVTDPAAPAGRSKVVVADRVVSGQAVADLKGREQSDELLLSRAGPGPVGRPRRTAGRKPGGGARLNINRREPCTSGETGAAIRRRVGRGAARAPAVVGRGGGPQERVGCVQMPVCHQTRRGPLG